MSNTLCMPVTKSNPYIYRMGKSKYHQISISDTWVFSVCLPKYFNIVKRLWYLFNSFSMRCHCKPAKTYQTKISDRAQESGNNQSLRFYTKPSRLYTVTSLSGSIILKTSLKFKLRVFIMLQNCYNLLSLLCTLRYRTDCIDE